MKKITNREKILIGFGAIAAIAIIAYFLILPLFKNGQSASTQEAKQEKLESVKKLKNMDPMITELEKELKAQLGYDKITFTPRTAESAIMTQVAQMANQSEIREVEQLDVKPERSKKKQTNQRNDQSILKSVVDKMYLAQVKYEKNNPIVSETNPADNTPKEEKDVSKDSATKNEQEAEPVENASSDNKTIFPVMPKDIPDDVKQNLVSSIQNLEGKTLSGEDIEQVIGSSSIKDKDDADKIKKRLVLYSERVKEKKGEVLGMITKLGIVQKTGSDDKIGRYSIKMVFKSDISQLVKLLYNIQNTAKWVKIDGMNVSVADRQRALLAVELTMTASALYE